MEEPESRSKKIADFLQTVIATGGLKLKYSILAADSQAHSSNPTATTPDPEIRVEFSGPDTSLLLARNGELLLALEHVAAKVLRFEHEEHDRISFDADNFKVLRQRELQLAAEVAIEKVRHTGLPFAFAPMTSRERRLLHLALSTSGLPTASSGFGSRRFVVLYPEGQKPVEDQAPTPTPDRVRAIRNTFRRR
ncbi:MAG TPA: R3H domain-containing nucleic acid-binding protein [Edaphobacter sp.]